MIKELIAAAAKQPAAFPLQTLAPGTIYYQNQRLRETPDVVITMNDKSAVALMDYFVHVCVTYTNCVPSVAVQCLDLVYGLDTNFYTCSFWHYLALCKQTNNWGVPGYQETLGKFGYGMQKYWVYGNDTNRMQAMLDTARVTIGNYPACTREERHAMYEMDQLHLEPRERSTSTNYVPYEMLVAAIKGPGSPTYKRWLLQHLTHYIRRDAYQFYVDEGRKYYTGKNAREHEELAKRFLEPVKDVEERERLLKKSGSAAAVHKYVAAEYAAALAHIKTLQANAKTPADGLACWRAVKELDARRYTWSAGSICYSSDLFVKLATNCNGALIKDVLKQEMANTSNYVERADHVPVAAMILLGMYLDAADVPWLVKYVNAARPLPRPMYDDDKYMVDIARQIAFLQIMEVALKHNRRAALQAYADALTTVRDCKVRDSAREWLTTQGITPGAAPEPATQLCDQSKQDAAATNTPHAVTQKKEDAPE